MTPAGPEPVDLLVDWDLAARAAARVARPGPVVPAEVAARAVSDLRAAAVTAGPHVRRVARMDAPPGPDAVVVDRAGWARANADSFRDLLAPVALEAFARRGSPPTGLSAVGSRVTGAEVGALLGFLSSRVLGQFDPYRPPSGRLLLVAPNLVQAEQELGVDPGDFRLWVCLHEETHRVQFTAHPWLGEQVRGEIRGLVADVLVDPGQLAERLAGLARSLPELLRARDDASGTAPQGSGAPLLDAVQSPEQRRRLARVTAVMSLLEGHADVVMDEVGPQVVPSVALIRERFTRRRAGRGAVDRLLRRLLGLEAKMRQYADGARFVRETSRLAGPAGFDAVWSSPATLPLPEEIADPAAWVRRVHG